VMESGSGNYISQNNLPRGKTRIPIWTLDFCQGIKCKSDLCILLPNPLDSTSFPRFRSLWMKQSQRGFEVPFCKSRVQRLHSSLVATRIEKPARFSFAGFLKMGRFKLKKL
jgi:hypothetical protein